METLKENSSQTQMNFNEIPDAELVEKYQRKELGPEASRLLYYVLTDSAAEYRHKFVDNDIDSLTKSINQGDDHMKAVVGPESRNMSIKNIRKKFGEIIDKEKSRLRQLTKMNVNEVNNFVSRMPDMETRVKFKRISSSMLECSEQILLAQDANEVLMLLKMYNSGDLDLLFTEYRKSKGGTDETTAAGAEQKDI